MNPKVEQLIQEEQEREAKKRAEILISLGLCEEERENMRSRTSLVVPTHEEPDLITAKWWMASVSAIA